MLLIPESEGLRQVLSHWGISLSWSNRDTAQRANSHVEYNSLGEMFRRVLLTQSSNFHANSCLWGKIAIGPSIVLMGHPLPTPVGCGNTTWRKRSICLFSFSPSEHAKHKWLLCCEGGVRSTLLLLGKNCIEMRSCVSLLLSRWQEQRQCFSQRKQNRVMAFVFCGTKKG